MTSLLVRETDWKRCAVPHPSGYFELSTEDTAGVHVRLFLTESLLTVAEPTLYRQIVNATRFPGVRLVAITPDVHFGYGVPVGSVIVTSADDGALAMGPVGFDIGCGMVLGRSSVSASLATHDRRLAFNREVMKRVAMGKGGGSIRLGKLSQAEFENLVRGGAEYYVDKYGASFDRTVAERHRLPVDDDWDIPVGGRGRPERGLEQLGSLGGGNHFIELQSCERTGTLAVLVHTGSRGFGHGLATHYFDLAKEERGTDLRDIDLGYFTRESPHHRGYQNAVSAGGNFAILNRLVIFEQIAEAFERVFRDSLELYYEISHNLVQREVHPEFGEVWVHRKGATRAFPKGHPSLAGGPWSETGHPVLVPGSNRDYSYVLFPEPGAVASAYSVNHGAGRRMSRGEAERLLDQQKVNEQYARDGIVVNDEADVPLDESAQCYKRAEDVIDAVLRGGLARVDSRYSPLASLKGTEEGEASLRVRERRSNERARDTSRRKARSDKRGRS